MIKILVLEDDVKQDQIVCAYLSGSGFQAKGCLNAMMPTMNCITIFMT